MFKNVQKHSKKIHKIHKKKKFKNIQKVFRKLTKKNSKNIQECSKKIHKIHKKKEKMNKIETKHFTLKQSEKKNTKFLFLPILKEESMIHFFRAYSLYGRPPAGKYVVLKLFKFDNRL